MFTRATETTPRRLEKLPVFPEKLKESPARKGFITIEQYAVLARNAKPLWLRCLIACANSFGFRKTELLDMRVGQVDLLGRWIELYDGETKNNEPRRIHMTEEVFRLVLECIRGKKQEDFVFTRSDGSRVCDPRTEWYDLAVASDLGQFVPAKRKNGEDYLKYVGLNLHDFRRSAIRNMTRRGVSETVAMKISGHKTASVFRRYNIVSESDLVDAAAKIELSGQLKTDTKTDTSAQNPRSDSSQLPRM